MTLNPIFSKFQFILFVGLILISACDQPNLMEDPKVAKAGIHESTTALHPYHTDCAHRTSTLLNWSLFSDTSRQQLATQNFYPHIEEHAYPGIFSRNPSFISDGFDFPVGKPDAHQYFKAREFGEKKHLGEDWNGLSGGNTDLGDPVYTAANGVVTFAENVCCGWGKTIRVVHQVPDDPENQYVESIYSHLHNVQVQVGDLINRGQKIGTIGTANGQYSAHLHFEIRNFVGMSLGPGYSDDTFGYLIPTKYIKQYRPH